MVQYTLMRATANGADPWESYREEYTPETQPRREFLMGYDRTHDINISATYNFSSAGPFKFFGISPLAKSSINIVTIATSKP